MVDALFIGAHPDDYEAFAGGTILRLKNEGKSCVGIILTDGSAGKNNDVNNIGPKSFSRTILKTSTPITRQLEKVL